MKGEGGGKYVSAVSCTPHINLRPPNTLPRPSRPGPPSKIQGLKKKKPFRWETKWPSSYQNKSGFLNSTFKTILKVLRWSVVQLSVFAIAQVLTTVLNKAGFTSWVDNLHHRNFLVSLTGSRLIYIELDSTGPQSLVKAFIPFPSLWLIFYKEPTEGPVLEQVVTQFYQPMRIAPDAENSDQQFQDHVGGA